MRAMSVPGGNPSQPPKIMTLALSDDGPTTPSRGETSGRDRKRIINVTTRGGDL